MGLRRKKLVEPLRSGAFRLNIEDGERQLVVRLMGELREVVLRSDPDGPGVRRLFPTAYHSDPEADAEYQRLMREELVASRLAGIETVTTALAAPEMTADELYATMQGINSLRLVLGTMLDLSEDDDLREVTDDDPHAAEAHLYDYLSLLLDHIVGALSGGVR
jgi:hypothetical protein